MPGTLVDSGELTLIYALDGVRDMGVQQGVQELHELGRFERNMARGNPHWLKGRPLTPLAAGTGLRCTSHGELDLEVNQGWIHSFNYECVQLSLKARFLPSSVHAVAELLKCTCHERDGLTVDSETPLLDLAGELEWDTHRKYGMDVHSIVALDRLPAGWGRDELIQVAYREADRRPRHEQPVAEPAELNRFEDQFCIHGRGVTVLVGHDPHMVAACTLVAQGLLILVQQVRRLEQHASALLDEATELTKRNDFDHSDSRIKRVAALAAEVQRLDVRVATDVERIFANSSLPEIVLDNYRESLAETLGLSQAIQTTSRTLEKVREFISAEFERMSSAHREALSKRENFRALLAAGASTVFLPTSLFLAAMGMSTADIGKHTSLFSLHYLPLWVAYIFVMAVGASVVVTLARKRK